MRQMMQRLGLGVSIGRQDETVGHYLIGEACSEEEYSLSVDNYELVLVCSCSRATHMFARQSQ